MPSRDGVSRGRENELASRDVLSRGRENGLPSLEPRSRGRENAARPLVPLSDEDGNASLSRVLLSRGREGVLASLAPLSRCASRWTWVYRRVCGCRLRGACPSSERTSQNGHARVTCRNMAKRRRRRRGQQNVQTAIFSCCIKPARTVRDRRSQKSRH